MTLRRMQVTDFRCLPSAGLEFDPAFTLIFGANASGKTSLLEAVYVLGRGRSFRTRLPAHLIRHGTDRFVVFGEVDAGGRIPLGVEGSDEGVRARILGEKPANLAALALRLPVQIIDPEVHRLIEEGPNRRRRFMDWGVFHVEPEFVGFWQRYGHVLRQRNAALKGRDRALVSAWDADLVQSGLRMSEARGRYVERLAPVAGELARQMLGMELTLGYRTGWSREHDLAAALRLSLSTDLERGVTQAGPHRAELAIRLDGSAVKDRISRGQQKLLAAALLLAQLRLFPDNAITQPTLLLDDPAAELDADRLGRLIDAVRQQPVQLVVTTLQPDFPAFGVPGRRYHVSAGTVSTTA